MHIYTIGFSLLMARTDIVQGIVVSEDHFQLSESARKHVINISSIQTMVTFSNEIMTHHLSKNSETFLLAPRSLQKSLARLATMAMNGSVTKSMIENFLSCSVLDNVEFGCQFLLEEDDASYHDDVTFWNEGLSKENAENDIFVVGGAKVEIGKKKHKQHIQLFHSYDCPVMFDSFIAFVKMKVIPESNLQLLEFDIDQGRSTLQIIMSIEFEMESLWLNFAKFGFDAFDALIDVDGQTANIFLPVISLKMRLSLKSTLSQAGLGKIFRSSNADFEEDMRILDFIQFNSLAIFPMDAPSRENSWQTSAILVNRPFIFRLTDKGSMEPTIVGLVTCPSDEAPTYGKCADIQRNCKRHNFCTRLDAICHLWNECA